MTTISISSIKAQVDLLLKRTASFSQALPAVLRSLQSLVAQLECSEQGMQQSLAALCVIKLPHLLDQLARLVDWHTGAYSIEFTTLLSFVRFLATSSRVAVAKPPLSKEQQHFAAMLQQSGFCCSLARLQVQLTAELDRLFPSSSHAAGGRDHKHRPQQQNAAQQCLLDSMVEQLLWWGAVTVQLVGSCSVAVAGAEAPADVEALAESSARLGGVALRALSGSGWGMQEVIFACAVVGYAMNVMWDAAQTPLQNRTQLTVAECLKQPLGRQHALQMLLLTCVAYSQALCQGADQEQQQKQNQDLQQANVGGSSSGGSRGGSSSSIGGSSSGGNSGSSSNSGNSGSSSASSWLQLAAQVNKAFNMPAAFLQLAEYFAAQQDLPMQVERLSHLARVLKVYMTRESRTGQWLEETCAAGTAGELLQGLRSALWHLPALLLSIAAGADESALRCRAAYFAYKVVADPGLWLEVSELAAPLSHDLLLTPTDSLQHWLLLLKAELSAFAAATPASGTASSSSGSNAQAGIESLHQVLSVALIGKLFDWTAPGSAAVWQRHSTAAAALLEQLVRQLSSLCHRSNDGSGGSSSSTGSSSTSSGGGGSSTGSSSGSGSSSMHRQQEERLLHVAHESVGHFIVMHTSHCEALLFNADGAKGVFKRQQVFSLAVSYLKLCAVQSDLPAIAGQVMTQIGNLACQVGKEEVSHGKQHQHQHRLSAVRAAVAPWLVLMGRICRLRAAEVSEKLQGGTARPGAATGAGGSSSSSGSSSGSSSRSVVLPTASDLLGGTIARIMSMLQIYIFVDLRNVSGHELPKPTLQDPQQPQLQQQSGSQAHLRFPLHHMQYPGLFVAPAAGPARAYADGGAAVGEGAAPASQGNAASSASSSGSSGRSGSSGDSSSSACVPLELLKSSYIALYTELMALMNSTPQDQVAAQLDALGTKVCSLAPVPWLCNAVGCTNMAGGSEVLLVAGKSCVCGGCKIARYCSRSCQKGHWRQHKEVCKSLTAVALATATAPAAPAPAPAAQP